MTLARKVLVINNIANTSPGIIRAYEEIGISACLVEMPKRKVKTKKLRHLIDTAIATIRLASECKKFDFVHVNYAYFGIIPILAKKEFIIHCHGSDLREKNRLKKITHASLNLSKRILYSTPDLIDHIPKKHHHKSFFAPNVIDTEIFKSLPQKNQVKKKYRIFCISKLDKTKGNSETEKALKELFKNPKIEKISIFNFGNSKEKNITKIKNKKLNKINKISHDKMSDLINDHDIIIGQNKIGAIGMSELESMSCGKPTLAYFKYHLFYSEDPPIIQTKNSQQIISEINNLIENPKKISIIGKASREWVIKNHSYKQLSKALKIK